MKPYFLIVAIFFVFHSASAQNWFLDLDEAKKEAASSHKNILLVFQGSDWCAPCIKLDKEIWQSQEFISFSKDHWALLKADFPRKKANQLDPEQQKKNNSLAEKYNQQGYFPLVVLLDPDGKVLGTSGYKNIPPKDYIDMLLSFEK